MNESPQNPKTTSGLDPKRGQPKSNGNGAQQNAGAQQPKNPSFNSQEKNQTLFSGQKQQLMSGIDTISSVLHNVTSELRREGTSSTIADYTEKFEHGVADFKNWMSDLSLQSALQSTREFARRRPEIMLVGMFGAGLLMGRFLKSAGVAAASAATTQMQNQDEAMPEVH